MEACISRVLVYRQQNFLRVLRNVSDRYLCSQKENSSGSSKTSEPKENEPNSAEDNASKLVSKAEDNKHFSQKKVDSHEDENETKNKKEANEKQINSTHSKLISVLSDIKVTEQPSKQIGVFNLNLAKPPRRLGKPIDTIKQQLRETKRVRHGDDMLSAVKEAASSLGGDVQGTAQQLVEKLVSIDPKDQNHLPIGKKMITKKKRELRAKIVTDENKNIMTAVKAVASTVENVPEHEESELTKKLLSLAAKKRESKTDDSFSQSNLVDLFEGMEIERKKMSWEIKSINRNRQGLKMKIDIFQFIPLDIFNLENKDAPQSSPHLLLWDKLQQKELKLFVQFAPTNAYEEIIQLTEQGKFWTFPIDNEAGMTEEAKVGFHEHVFLDHLIKDFPKKGPIRHFMELVITGLSKNPYVTIQRKAEHVQWFRDYFADKQDILKQYEIEA